MTHCSQLDDLQRYIRWVLPPVLIVLDDYDPGYKTKGVVMVHAIINKLNSSLIARTGLDRLFFESLFKCLTYLSDQPTLLSVSYPCILDLIDKMDKREGLYERVLREGVLTGFLYAGQKRKFLPILLAPIARIYQAIGILGVQYLKALIPTLCQTLTLSKDKAIHSLALDGLGAIMQACWPRMSHYQGTLMVTLSQTWQNYYPEDVEMCDTIKQVYRLFKLTCPTKLDEDVLVKFNPIFEPLFSA
ncbi:hypothetical protein BD560DRAFT_393347 [Blakeslea trispora]|nr:hypothetical protein BD560DRAFT_393347 [Blakeslea trispora]